MKKYFNDHFNEYEPTNDGRIIFKDNEGKKHKVLVYVGINNAYIILNGTRYYF